MYLHSLKKILDGKLAFKRTQRQNGIGQKIEDGTRKNALLLLLFKTPYFVCQMHKLST